MFDAFGTFDILLEIQPFHNDTTTIFAGQHHCELVYML